MTKVERYVRRIQPLLASCQHCEPVFEGETYWIEGEQKALDELLNDVGVPHSLRAAVVRQLRCGYCGCSYEEGDDVGKKSAFRLAHETALACAKRRFGKRLRDFASFLEKYPMLGADHPIGRRIVKEINGFPTCTCHDQVWYRARRIKHGCQFTPDDMRLPDPVETAISSGRFNHEGQAHWYLAANVRTAMSEVLKPPETWAWLQSWKVNLDRVLDLLTFAPDEEPRDEEDAKSVGGANLEEVPLVGTAMIFGDHLRHPTDGKDALINKHTKLIGSWI